MHLNNLLCVQKLPI